MSSLDNRYVCFHGNYDEHFHLIIWYDICCSFELWKLFCHSACELRIDNTHPRPLPVLQQRPFERYATTVFQYVHGIFYVYLFYTILYIRHVCILWFPCKTNSMGTYHTIIHRLRIYLHVYFLLSKQTKYDQESNDGCEYTYTIYTTYGIPYIYINM